MKPKGFIELESIRIARSNVLSHLLVLFVLYKWKNSCLAFVSPPQRTLVRFCCEILTTLEFLKSCNRTS